MLAIESPIPQFFNLDGTPLNAGKLYFGTAGANPEVSPIPVYWDAAGTIPASQPIATSNGYPVNGSTLATVYIASDYSLTVRTSAGVLVMYAPTSADFSNAAAVVADIASTATAKGAALVGYKSPAANSAARTVAGRLADFSTLADFGGTTDQKFGYAATAGSAYIPDGTYSLTAFAPGVFWGASRSKVVDSNNNAPIVYLDETESRNRHPGRAKQMLRANGYLQNNYLQGVVNLGDSISHGAYSGNAYTNHWAYLLARAIVGEFGGKGIGEFPMEGLYNATPALATPQLADVVFSAGWGAVGANPAPYDYPVGNIGASATNSVNGKTYSSTTSGATITLTIPTMGRAISFKYTQQPGGGTFTIKINGVVKATVNTAGVLTYNVNTSNVAVEDNGKGECVVVITKSDTSPTEINSLFNLKTDVITTTDLSARMQLHNYAQSGRALGDLSEGAIARACNSAALIVSLGYNDWSLGSDSNDGVFNTFKQRIDWLIQYAKVYRTLVVVQDFVWYATTSSRTRQQLKRLADATQGIYIPYPEQFFSDRINPTQSPLVLNDPMWLWADAAHPNALGNELIFSTLATALGLACNSRSLALKYFDWPYPLKISSANLLNNDPTFPGSLTTVQQIGDEYHFKVNIKPSGPTFTSGVVETALSALPAKFRPTAPSLLNQANGASFTYATGVVKTFAILESPTTLNIYANVGGETICRCSFNVAEIV